VELEQPIFGANYIKGKVRAQPGGNFTGIAPTLKHFFSVSEPDPNWILSGHGSRFEIRIQEGKNDPQKKKKVEKFHVLKCWMLSF
jgi:hypothetical protein